MSRPAVAALGAGRMGRGIALAFAGAGERVALIDVKERGPGAFETLRAESLRDIEGQIRALVDLRVVPDAAVSAILNRIEVCGRDAASETLAQVDLLFEGVPEVMAAKAETFAFAARALPVNAIVASTSSTFLSTALAELVPGPQRFLNAHWLNPAHLIPLVEISPHVGTDPSVSQRLCKRLEAIGKIPVLCGASPGYIVPRMQALIMNEAARMIEEGVASAEDIDRATRYGFGIRYAAMGVVEFIDVGGNDILYYASRYLSEALGSERYACPEIVADHMAQGRNGLRSGKGFYDWTGKDIDAFRKQSTARLLELLRIAGRMPVMADAVDRNESPPSRRD
ncbi:MAG: 3-hydroxybutyryl-CoA dehydrogenase [Rhodocyclaceae bacterium]|nr:3-hydroxybutyryl-CoA dehydrogenase [Rhodocyclaceae bacterium]